MKLIDLYIENFGKLSDFKLSFTDGINTINKENGYGKTTLSVFIKSMLYGLDDTKKVKLESNDRKHYMPWQGGRCGGYLTFIENGKKYRIERTFMPKASDDTYKIYDLKNGKETTDFGEIPGEEIFGIDADGFERTVFLSEANLSGKNENKTISAKLSDLVGTDGDIGVMDEAMELLEKQRKFYYKKGGAGEIGVVKRKISDIDLTLGDIFRTQNALEDDKKRLKSVNAQLESLYLKKKERDEAARLAEKQRLRQTYLKHYKEIEESLKAEEETKRKIEAFFINGIPDEDELNRIKNINSRYKSYCFDDKIKNESATPTSADKFFGEDFSSEEFLRIKSTLSQVEIKKARLEMLKEKQSANESQSSYFRKPVSDAREVDRIIDSLINAGKPQKTKKLFPALLTFPALFFVLGVALGYFINAYLYAPVAVGLILLIPAFKNISRVKKTKKQSVVYKNAKNYLFEYTFIDNANDAEIAEKLYELKAQIEKAKKDAKSLAEFTDEISTLTTEISDANREACEFISKFPIENKSSITEAIYEIERKLALKNAYDESQKESLKMEKIRSEEKQRLLGELTSFSSGFRVTTENPIDEIAGKIIEYNSVCRSVDRIKAALSAYAAEHGISSQNIESFSLPSDVKADESEGLDTRISELEKEKTLLERQCRISSEEVNKIYDLQTEKDALLEKEANYTKNLTIILKTMELLNKAKDSLTSKYLSKTKAAFDKYIAIISREDANEFKLDTSFSVMKNEKGSLKASEAYSKGTKDMIALAIRLALVDSLYDNEAPFIVLDDPFAHFDDRKFSYASSVIKAIARDRQIIYLTCSESRVI